MDQLVHSNKIQGQGAGLPGFLTLGTDLDDDQSAQPAAQPVKGEMVPVVQQLPHTGGAFKAFPGRIMGSNCHSEVKAGIQQPGIVSADFSHQPIQSLGPVVEGTEGECRGLM